MSAIRSVRLSFGRGDSLDLAIDGVPQDACELEIKTEAGGNYRLSLHLAGNVSVRPERDVDATADDAAGTNRVDDANRDIVGINRLWSVGQGLGQNSLSRMAQGLSAQGNSYQNGCEALNRQQAFRQSEDDCA